MVLASGLGSYPIHRMTLGRQRRSGCALFFIQFVNVVASTPEALADTTPGEASAAVCGRVVAARARQAARYDGSGIRTNADLTPSLLPIHCALDRAALRILDRAIRRLALSARAYDRVRK